MTISTEQIFKEILDLDCEQIPLARLAFFREELRNRLYAEVVRRFHALGDRGFTKAHLARRIGKSPEQVIRWLGAPGNWTLDTASDLLIGMRAIPNVQADDLIGYLAPADGDTVARTDALVKDLANRSAPSDSNTKQLLDKITSQAAGAALTPEPTTSAANTSPFESVPQPSRSGEKLYRIAEMKPQSELGDFVKKVGMR